MLSMRCFHLLCGGLLVTAQVCHVGCGASVPDARSLVRTLNNANGKRLVNLYAQYQAQHGTSPRDEKTFKAFISGRPAMALAEMGVTENGLDKLFVSERDGLPLHVRYAAPFRPDARQAVVFEAQGVNGRSAVFFSDSRCVEVPTDELPAYTSGRKDETPPADAVPPRPGG